MLAWRVDPARSAPPGGWFRPWSSSRSSDLLVQ